MQALNLLTQTSDGSSGGQPAPSEVLRTVKHKMVLLGRIELPTSSLPMTRSTTELQQPAVWRVNRRNLHLTQAQSGPVPMPSIESVLWRENLSKKARPQRAAVGMND